MGLLIGALNRLTETLRTVAGALSFTGSVGRIIDIGRTLAGALSFAGEVAGSKYTGALEYAYTAEAVLTAAGAVYSRLAEYWRTLTGSVSFAGNVFKGFSITKASSLSFSGNLTRIVEYFRTTTGRLKSNNIHAELDGILTFAGVVVTYEILLGSYSGAISFVGSLTSALRTFARTLTSTFTPSGTSSRYSVLSRTYTGALTLSSEAFKALEKTYTGAISFAGSATNAAGLGWARTYDGALTLSGAYSRLAEKARTVAGSITPTGWMEGILTGAVNYGRDVSGALYLVGELVRVVMGQPRSTDGNLYSIGYLTYIDAWLKRFSDASLVLVGAISRNLRTTRTMITGSASFAGEIYTGILGVRITKAGALSYSSILSRYSILQRILPSEAGPAFDNVMYFQTSVYAEVESIVGFTKSIFAVFMPEGALTRLINSARTKAGSLTSSATAVRSSILNRTYTAALTFSQTMTYTYKRGTAWTFFNTITSNLRFAGAIFKSFMARTTYSASGLLRPSGSARGVYTIESLYFGPELG